MDDDSALGFLALDDDLLAAQTGSTRYPAQGYSSVPVAVEARGASGLCGLSNQCVTLPIFPPRF